MLSALRRANVFALEALRSLPSRIRPVKPGERRWVFPNTRGTLEQAAFPPPRLLRGRYAHIAPGRLHAVMQTLNRERRTDPGTDPEPREAANAPRV